VTKVLLRLQAIERNLEAGIRALENDRSRFLKDRAELDRSVALRIKVERDFTRPIGPLHMLTVAFYPEEFKHQFYYNNRRYADHVGNASYFAEGTSQEVAQQVKEVLLKCIAGELKDYEKAK
jgi:hypothetical protein